MLTVIIPAHNEANFIGPCLQAVFRSDGDLHGEIIVVANGCDDNTVEIAQNHSSDAKSHGWNLIVIDLAKGGKPGALNAGDQAANFDQRVYLDADVIVSPPLLAQIFTILEKPEAQYASGTLCIPRPASFISRAYCAIYRQVPFMTHGVPGAGLFAMNGAGRARWGEWPDIISDDTYARLMFAPHERVKVAAKYDWPIVEGWMNLVAVRRRQNAGVDEIRSRYPDLLANDNTPKLGKFELLKLAISHPLGFLIYAAVAFSVRISRPKDRGDWRRGR